MLLVDVALDWIMQVDLGQKHIFPPKILTASLRLDLVTWSTSQKIVLINELTVPWEAEIFERKRLRYTDIAVKAD